MAIPEFYWKQLYILFVKGVVGFREIVSSHLYVRSKGTCSLTNQTVVNTDE